MAHDARFPPRLTGIARSMCCRHRVRYTHSASTTVCRVHVFTCARHQCFPRSVCLVLVTHALRFHPYPIHPLGLAHGHKGYTELEEAECMLRSFNLPGTTDRHIGRNRPGSTHRGLLIVTGAGPRGGTAWADTREVLPGLTGCTTWADRGRAKRRYCLGRHPPG